MAKSRLSAKQIKAGFGGARRKAALRSRPKHRARTKPNPTRKRRKVAAAPPKRRRRAVAKKNSARKRRKNPTPMIISWAAGNPAKRGKKVAAPKRRRRATAKTH